MQHLRPSGARIWACFKAKVRVWGCRRCGVLTDTLDGYGWCGDCKEVEYYYRHRERQRGYYATKQDAA
jgi:hypothetical protein